jgi:flagellar hook-associated protein FlgK
MKRKRVVAQRDMWAVLNDLITESSIMTLYTKDANPDLAASVEKVNQLISELTSALKEKFVV